MIRTFYTSVAGINFENRVTDEDLGPILGYVEKEPDNKYNPKAVAVKRTDGERLGYISDKDLDDFYKFLDTKTANVLPFSGNIKKKTKYGKPFYIGDIAILISDNEEELTEAFNKNLFDENLNLYGRTYTDEQ